MFVDGLWLSGITLEIDRSDLPIPKTSQHEPIRIELTRTQMNAVVALLGFGMRGGDFLMYQDEDLSRLMCDKNDSTIRSDYISLSSGVKDSRKAFRVFTPFVAMHDTSEDIDDYSGFIGDDDSDELSDGGFINTDYKTNDMDS
jgi:hypothetical protein